MTAIEWTDVTWNPVRGCSRVSPGCENCYAERQAARPILSAPGKPYHGLVTVRSQASGLRYESPGAAGSWTAPRWTGKVVLDHETLAAPLRWKKPRRVFVNSMSDMFHESLTDEQIAAVFGVMAATPQHTYQILTKRAERMARWFADVSDERRDTAMGRAFDLAPERRRDDLADFADHTWPPGNVWLGVSVEDQQRADERIPHLLRCPAAVRFLSVEPLLGEVDLRQAQHERAGFMRQSLDSIDWVIVGGESGPGARPFRPEWAASISEQCRAAGVAYFFKQAGSRVAPPSVGGPRSHGPIDCKGPTGSMMWQLRLADRKGGDVAELAAALPEFAAAGVFRREWPEVKP